MRFCVCVCVHSTFKLLSQVVIYGDGTRTPLILRDWALVDYDHLWQQGISYKIPHCIAETFQHLTQRIDK